ncbi:serine hydrolase domain-containing protein [Candidatus Foliamicus sp.]
MLKRILKGLAATGKWILIVIAVIGVVIYLPSRLGWYGIYAKRYVISLSGNPLSPARAWYDPHERVAGGEPAPLEAWAEGENPIAADIYREASSWAQQQRSDSLVVLYKGRLAHASYFNGRTPDSEFSTHSLTKVLNSILVGHAIADGYVQSVDQPAADFLPEWDTDERRDITLRDLLNMAGGLQETFAFWPGSPRLARTMGTDIVTANLDVGIYAPPGTAFTHANPNSQVAGIVLERAVGMRFGDYLAQKLWAPLGLRDGWLFLDRPGGMAHTDCCMWTAIEDWAHIGQMLLQDGCFAGQQIIPEGWVNEMTTPSAANENYGMQLWLGTSHKPLRTYDPNIEFLGNLHSEPFVADDVFFLDGAGDQRLYMIPSRELVILRTGKDGPEWDDALLPNLFTRAVDSISGQTPATRPTRADLNAACLNNPTE